ncbi:MAG: HYExAFE family protein [Fimbriiglobus sp.]|jgi:hypothetical protein|nr:HYExAFE family protein [Fimbriiglobus sp.]
MIRSNHYEAAFEAYLRSRGVMFIPTDEARRSPFGDTHLKSADFIILDTARLVVDVKGRKFPSGSANKPNTSWQNWAEEEDINALGQWADCLGPGYRGVLAFAYQIQPPFALPENTPDLFAFRADWYLLRGIDVTTYREHMRPRSKNWKTVHLPADAFRRIVRPFSTFLNPKG